MAFLPVFSLLSFPKANAQIAAPISPTEHAAIYQSWRFMVECAVPGGVGAQAFITDARDRPQLQNGDVFRQGGEAYDIPVGYLLDPNDNGRLKCDDQGDAQLAVQASGFDGFDLFTRSGIYVSGDGGFRLADMTNDQRITAITNYFGAAYPGIDFSHNATLHGGIQYWMMLKAFQTRCIQSADALGSTMIREVSRDDASISENRYFLRDVESINVGYGNSQGSDQQMSCNELVDYINQFADSAARLQTNYFNQGGQPEGSLGGVGAGDDEERDSCESNGGVMGWIMCPVAKLLDGIFGQLLNQMEALLNIEENKYRDDRLREAWENMRNIAYVVLIPIMLLMVIGTALGFEVFSAYTVKKALPRMAIAVIFIALSWEIVGFLITLSNVVGVGTAGIIKAPFGIDSFADVFNPNAAQSAGQWAFLAGGAAALYFSPAILGIVISFLGTVVLILATVFVFLVARQLFIMALMLVAPLAILAWIFPGNDKLWKSWWSIFSKLLLIYPIIMAVTAVGMVFADILGPGSTGNAGGAPVERVQDILTPLMKLAAFIIPFALIPALFKFVGGFIGNLAGMVNDREKGMFDRLKQSRSKNYGQLGRDVRSGQFARNNTSGLGGVLSKSLRGASAPTSIIPGRLGSGGRNKINTATLGMAGATEAEKDIAENISLDDGLWNEFAQYGHSQKAFQGRLSQLRTDGEGVRAAELERFSSKVGNREYAIGAANLASKSGKLQDASVHALDNYFGNSAADISAKSSIAGGLGYNMKQKGNYVGTAIGVGDDGKFETYSSLLSSGQEREAYTRMSKKIVQAGPGALGNMPGYEMQILGADGKTVVDKKSAKEIAFEAIGADTDVSATFGDEMIEEVAMQAQPGSYTDAATKKYANEAMTNIRNNAPGWVSQDANGNLPSFATDSSGATKAVLRVGDKGVIEGSRAHTILLKEQSVRRPTRSELDGMES